MQEFGLCGNLPSVGKLFLNHSFYWCEGKLLVRDVKEKSYAKQIL